MISLWNIGIFYAGLVWNWGQAIRYSQLMTVLLMDFALAGPYIGQMKTKIYEPAPQHSWLICSKTYPSRTRKPPLVYLPLMLERLIGELYSCAWLIQVLATGWERLSKLTVDSTWVPVTACSNWLYAATPARPKCGGPTRGQNRYPRSFTVATSSRRLRQTCIMVTHRRENLRLRNECHDRSARKLLKTDISIPSQ